VFQSYRAGAAHPNSTTGTLNFAFRPLRELRVQDLFEPSTKYLGALSEYCIDELHKQQPTHWHNPIERAEELKIRRDSWILSGAWPVVKNFERFLFVNEGITIFFDPYAVGSYAEGRYEVFVPFQVLRPFLRHNLNQLP
ncbi:MAG TPA: RsiV family protein, partial [Candidatus Dormibacteraeota bacterium]|nr:RsiV family protein [Candidatus Dormibacteraeota bacterium]